MGVRLVPERPGIRQQRAEQAAVHGRGEQVQHAGAVSRRASPRVEQGPPEQQGGPEEARVLQEVDDLAPDGGARMVSVSEKAPSLRRAVATSRIRMNAEAFVRIERADAPKGDVLGTARLAGIMAAKRTPDLIPLCHPIALTHVAVDFSFDEERSAVLCTATAHSRGRTGVEMEALTAVTVGLLTIYDMCKAVDRGMRLEGVRLLEKRGGKSGRWVAPAEVPGT